MDKDKFLNSITEIGNCEDDVERRNLLVSLSDEATKLFDTQDSLNTKINELNDSLTKANERVSKVQEYNMELYQRLDTQKEAGDSFENATGIKKEEPIKTKSFDELAKEFM